MGRNTWLVKSQGRILGPFSKEEVGRLLLDFEIVILDEVSIPYGRWNYLRDSEDFKEVVEEVRLKNLSQDGDTTTIFIDNETNTDTLQLTETQDFSDDLTEDLTAATLSEIVLDQVEERKTFSNKSIGSNTFVFEGDSSVKKETQKTIRFQWVFAIITVFAIVGFVLFKHFIEKPMKIQKQFEALTMQAKSKLYLGDYAKSLELFQEAERMLPDNRENDLYLGTLLIQIDHQTVLGKRFLASVLESNNKNNMKLAYTGIGIATLKDSQYEESLDFFQRALEIDPEFGPALINLGAANLHLKRYQKAVNYFQLVVKDGVKDAAATVMLVISYIKMWEKSKDPRYLEQALVESEKSIENAFDYKQELYFLKTYTEVLKSGAEGVEPELEAIMDMDPRLTVQHRHDLFVYRKFTQWKHLQAYCDSLVEKLNTTFIKTAFEGYCNIRTGDTVTAQRIVEDALLQAPSHSLIQSIYALTMIESGIEDPAKLALQRAISKLKDKAYKLPYQLMAEVCQKSSDGKCSEKEYWANLRRIDKMSLAAIAGLVDVYIRDNNLEAAESLLAKGLEYSQDYKPFIKLKKLLDLQKPGE